MIAYACFHCWCHAQRLVNPAEVVVHEIECNSVLVILQFLAESVGQPCEAAHSHSHAQVLALGEAGGNMVKVRSSCNQRLTRSHAARCTDAIALMIGLMLLPVVARSFYHPQRRPICLSNLKQIALAIAMYSDSHQGRCPMDSANPTLVGSMQLLSNVLPSAMVFYCPSDPRPGTSAEADFKKLTTNNISYSYVPNLMWLDTPDSPLAGDRIYATSAGSSWPRNGNHEGQGGNLLFNDGHVAWHLQLPSTLKDKDGKPVVLSP